MTSTRSAKARTRRAYETADYAKMVRRMIASWIKRVGDGDPADLADMIAASRQLDDGIKAAIKIQRETNGGVSWAQIGEAAGMTRQGAQQRWGK